MSLRRMGRQECLPHQVATNTSYTPWASVGRSFVPRYNAAMLHRLFTILSAFSLAVFVVTVAFWIRDRARTDRVSWVNAGGTRNWWAECSGGEIMTCFDMYPKRELSGTAGWIFETEEGTRNYQIFV